MTRSNLEGCIAGERAPVRSENGWCMARLSDAPLARRMLESRERGSYRFIFFVRMNAKGYVLLLLFRYFGAPHGQFAFR